MTLCVLASLVFYPCAPEEPPTVPIEVALREAIRRHFPEDTDIDLMIEIARCESRLDPQVVSRTNDYGIFQVNARVWADDLKKAGIAESMTDLLDLEVGVEAAAYVSRHHYRRDRGGHLAAWWGGPEYGGWGTGPGGNRCWP